MEVCIVGGDESEPAPARVVSAANRAPGCGTGPQLSFRSRTPPNHKTACTECAWLNHSPRNRGEGSELGHSEYHRHCGSWHWEAREQMRAVLQRVREASVTVDGTKVGQIGEGLLVLAGFSDRDDDGTLRFMAEKILNLRIFEDEAGKMNLSLIDSGGALLVVSQFTLYADCRKGRRPSFIGAAKAEHANQLYARFVEIARGMGVPVETGVFQAMMEVRLNNWGPVTINLDSEELQQNGR